VFVLHVFMRFVCVCVKWFCETCVFVFNVFVRSVFVLNVFVRFLCICVKWILRYVCLC